MVDLADQVEYWDTVGATKTFTHPLNLSWLSDVDSNARILDYGCGYGRVMAELSDHGFTDLAGVDLSSALISRARQLRPDLRFSVVESAPELDCPSDSFDVVLLFAVLTCVPDGSSQRALIAELGRVLAPGALLYAAILYCRRTNAARLATPDAHKAPAAPSACLRPTMARCSGITTSAICGLCFRISSW